MKRLIAIVLGLVSASCTLKAQSGYYFPPQSGNTWDTLSPTTLGWCADRIDSLYSFLESRNTKAFIVLHKGKIVLEKYYGSFTVDSAWYWASAGKSLTAFLGGMAVQEDILELDSPSSTYLGQGWTALNPSQEKAITVRHQLSMNTGLDDGVPDPDCTTPSCLVYKADPGTRWAYHNAPYHLVHDVLEQASGQTINTFTNARLNAKTGISGIWLQHVFYSRPRSAARFGLLMLNRGIWDTDTLLRDTAYFREMIHPSQLLNPAYGYLWWLNGQSTYMLPQSQFVFNGPLIPAAPADAYAALGKNDQKIYVAPSLDLVVVRMGNASGIPLFALSNFDQELWEYLNLAMCGQPNALSEPAVEPFSFYPNPFRDYIYLPETWKGSEIMLTDLNGKLIQSLVATTILDTRNLEPGIYLLKQASSPNQIHRILKVAY